MIVKNYENFLSQEIVDELLYFFRNNSQLYRDTMGMTKIVKPWMYTEHLLGSLLSKILPIEKNLGDNFYKHDFPYFTHIDSNNNPHSYNVLIPLYIHDNTEQKFVIFDQYCTDYSGATWLGDIWKPEGDFESNKKRDFPYKDPTVVGCTDKPVDPTLYNILKYDYRNEEMFYGLTGTAYDYKPGNVLIFPSNRLHCTGRMLCDYKIGLSLRFEVLDTTDIL
jgi:hypothetical protein